MASRYGGASSATTPRKKVAVTYTLRNQQEPMNRSGVNRIRIDTVHHSLYTAGRDSIIRKWDLSELAKRQDKTDPSMILEHHTDWVNDMVLCKEGTILMSGSSDTSLKVWDLGRGSCTSTLKPHDDYVQALAYSSHTETVVSAGLDHDLYLWDINALTSLTASRNTVTTVPLSGQKQSVYSVDINHQGTLVVSGSTEKALKVWDTRTYQKLMKLKGHTDNVRSVILNSDGTECLSGSSDGTVRLWSIGQQRCVETFRLHQGGVWALEVDESFKYFYSGGKDKNVYLTDMTGGTQDNSVLLFVEDKSILSLALDTSERGESLWVSTTGTTVKKWPAVAREFGDTNGVEEGEGEGMEGDDPIVTDIDEVTHLYNQPLLTIPGASTIIECKILNNKRQVLTKDTTGNIALWDVLHGQLVENLGSVDIEEAADLRVEPLFVPNWFSCDVKTGMLSIRLEENDCFSAWVMGNNTNLPNTSDLKLNYGALVLKALFEHWPESYTVKQEVRIEQERLEERRATVVTCDTFVSMVSTVTQVNELGRQLGLSEEVLESLSTKYSINDDTSTTTTLPNYYRQMFNYFQDDSLTVESLSKALYSLNYNELAQTLEKKLQSNNVTSNKVDTKFFSVLSHTPVVLSEATDCGPTLVRFTCSNVSNPHESNLLKNYCPKWVSDIVVQNQLPNHPKMSFLLGKDSVPKDKHDRLSAQDILTVKKVTDYLYGKLYEGKKDETTDTIEIYCQGQLLDPKLDMRTVRHTIWKSGGDMKLTYKIIEATPPTPPPSTLEENPQLSEGEEKTS